MTVLFDGIASGMLLFLISVGLSVTLGLMNFVNLAHGAFAMVWGYVCVTLLNRLGVPFLLSLPLAALSTAAVGVLLERVLYRRLYGATHLDQVLFSISLVFMSMAAATYFFGAQQQPLQLPEFLRGQFKLPGLDMGVYRLFLIVVSSLLAWGLQALVSGTRLPEGQFGALPAVGPAQALHGRVAGQQGIHSQGIGLHSSPLPRLSAQPCGQTGPVGATPASPPSPRR